MRAVYGDRSLYELDSKPLTNEQMAKDLFKLQRRLAKYVASPACTFAPALIPVHAGKKP